MRVSLGRRLRRCPLTHCLGVRPNWEDYAPQARDAIRNADVICYPGPHYGTLFESLGKGIFPLNYYPFLGNKIRQTCLFQLLGIPHPKTRLYYGGHRLRRIRWDFSFPFVAKTPLGSSQGSGVWLIQNEGQLRTYLQEHHPAYIQEYLPMDRDLRVVLIQGRVVHAYWRIAPPGEFRNNVSRGGRISFEGIPPEALQFAEFVAASCGFQEVGLDICLVEDRYWVIEANMVYGLEGFRQGGQDIYEIF
ncbi:MAG: ATP-grasp domain-containing protein, partial [Deltaproteobacteria bacterium]|nr:ATP-grasp domain-containing protein [Deltaproteobacteria bacterium]